MSDVDPAVQRYVVAWREMRRALWKEADARERLDAERAAVIAALREVEGRTIDVTVLSGRRVRLELVQSCCQECGHPKGEDVMVTPLDSAA